MNGTMRKYRKRPTNDMDLGGSSVGVETRRSGDVRFSVSSTEAESNFSDCFGLSHEKRVGDLSCSLGASADMRGTMERADKRRKRDSEGNHMNRQPCVFLSCLLTGTGSFCPLTQIRLRVTTTLRHPGDIPSWRRRQFHNDNRDARIGTPCDVSLRLEADARGLRSMSAFHLER